VSRAVAFVVETTVALVGVSLVAWALGADRLWWEEHVFVLDCATGQLDMCAIFAGRIFAALAGVLLVVFVRARLARRVAIAPRRALAAAGRMAAATALALVVGEAFLRLVAKPLSLDDVPLLRADAHLAIALRPNTSSAIVRGGRELDFAVDALGLRVKDPTEMPDLARPSILVAGESVAQGYSVRYEDSVPSLVQEATGLPTLNSGVATYASDQAYRRMQEILPLLAHPVAVVTFVVPVQIERNVSPRREHLELGAGGALTVVPPAPPIVRDMQLLRLFGLVGPHDGAAVRIARAIYVETAKEVRARGAYPLFVFTNFRAPCLHDDSGESSLAHRLFAGLDVPHVSVDIDPAWQVPDDGHPDARGDRALAAAIVGALGKAGVAGVAADGPRD
jgi:lysophospholipase L1-like esterase